MLDILFPVSFPMQKYLTIFFEISLPCPKQKIGGLIYGKIEKTGPNSGTSAVVGKAEAPYYKE